jgi:co-chaperonin GroES (HSP10)
MDFFKHGDAFFDMSRSCVISRSEVTNRDFSKLFGLHVAQQRIYSAPYTVAFLEYHLENNFLGKLSDFKEFLKQLIKTDYFLADINLKERIQTWLETTKDPIEEKQLEENKEPSSAIIIQSNETNEEFEEAEFSIMENDDLLATETNATKIGIGQKLGLVLPKVISGTMTEEEVTHYFSFLHEPTGEMDNSFLQKEEVEEMFQHGIVIPASPKARKFKLTLTDRFPRKIVDHFIHSFYVVYKPKGKKGAVLKFFGSYIEDYSAALDPSKIKNLKRISLVTSR